MPDSVLDAESTLSEKPSVDTPAPEPEESPQVAPEAKPADSPAAAETATVASEPVPAAGAAPAPAPDAVAALEPPEPAQVTTVAAEASETEAAEPAAPAEEPEAPAEEAPVEKALVEEAKVEEAKVEKAAVEEATVEEATVEEATVEEATAPAAVVTAPVETAAAAAETAAPLAEAAPEEAATVEAAPTASAATAPGEEKPAAGEAAEASPTAGEAEEAEEAEPVEESEEVKALRAAKESGETVKGKVIGWNRGGFHVALDNGVTAFCPNSEMETGRPKTAASYVDQELEFQVLKVQRRGRRVVLSRASLVKEQRDQLAAATRAKLQVGAVLPGRVSSVTDFGAFVDLGGLEGLVHVSEISRKRIGHAKQAVQVGQDVEVKVLKIEKDGERISLSMKALEPDPWSGVAERFPAGAEFTGKVVRKTDFGLFVELEPDVDGLVHLSRLPHGVEMGDGSLEVGKEISGWVQEVDTRRGRISLSLREVPQDDPWKGIEERLPEGSVVDGTIESVAPFGVFINLQPGLTGLLPGSETGVPRGANAARQYPPGKTISVQVVTVDRRRKRISLAREGTAIEGSKADYQAYRQQQSSGEVGGLSAMASAFAKLRGDDGEADSDSSD